MPNSETIKIYGPCSRCGTWRDVSPVSAVSVEMVIAGQLPSMKNRRRLFMNKRTGKPQSVKSEEALRYVTDFCAQVPMRFRGLKLGSLDRPLRLTVRVYYRSRRSDLDIELLKDCLQIAGVVGNDRYITRESLGKSVDKQNPRVEILLESLKED